MIVAIIGSTGLVGQEICKILKSEKNKRITKVLLVSTKESVKRLKTKNLITIEEAIKIKPNFVLFSAGSNVSIQYAQSFINNGAIIIDNSSAFRMNPKYKLIVPEINKHILKKEDKIIANPNCSTIQLVLPLYAIQKRCKIKRIVVSTYQAVTGSGKDAVKQLREEQSKKNPKKKIYSKQIFQNVIPQCDVFLPNGYTKEEEKIIQETNKILSSQIAITATAVRVPTIGGHRESVNVELEEEFDIQIIQNLIANQPGVSLDLGELYKTPTETHGKDTVFVSRLRRDYSVKNGLNFWIVADPLLKGAATNATQILTYLLN